MVSGRARGGFTLIELAIAVVLLAIGLLALTGALVRSLTETVDARAKHAALREAEEIADSLAAASSISAGSIEVAGVTIEWQPVSCGGAACARVSARTRTDTLTLLTAAALP